MSAASAQRIDLAPSARMRAPWKRISASAITMASSGAP